MSRFPSWSLFHKNLEQNIEVKQKMNQIMGFNQFLCMKMVGFQIWKTIQVLDMRLVNGFGKLVLLHNACYLQENIFCSKSNILGFVVIATKLTYTKLIPTLQQVL